MRQTELHLSAEDRSVIEDIRSKGVHHSREVNRAHVFRAWTAVCRGPRSWRCLESGARRYGERDRRICKGV